MNYGNTAYKPEEDPLLSKYASDFVIMSNAQVLNQFITKANLQPNNPILQ